MAPLASSQLMRTARAPDGEEATEEALRSPQRRVVTKVGVKLAPDMFRAKVRRTRATGTGAAAATAGSAVEDPLKTTPTATPMATAATTTKVRA
jgi:hypothetical protein